MVQIDKILELYGFTSPFPSRCLQFVFSIVEEASKADWVETTLSIYDKFFKQEEEEEEEEVKEEEEEEGDEDKKTKKEEKNSKS